MPQIKTAFFSAYNKKGLETFAGVLVKRGINIWASAGTAKYLSQNGVSSNSIESLTGFEDLLDGRVKTLHPAVFAGILARNTESDISSVLRMNFPVFDLVYIDLYSFSEKLNKVSNEDQIELIDIGGVSLLRAAAKNFNRVVVSFNQNMLQSIIGNLGEQNHVSLEIAKNYAMETFFYTANYDSIIARWLMEYSSFPEYFAIAGSNLGLPKLRYGENPHQKAALYATIPNEGVLSAKVLWGKALSYNDILDLDAAIYGVTEFEDTACVIIKHLSPCGVAIGKDTTDAYKKALASDPMSAFGGIVALNQPIGEEVATLINKRFYNCVIAPDYATEALEILKRKKNIRILRLPNLREKCRYSVRTVLGGLLLQEIDKPELIVEKWDIVTKIEPTIEQKKELIFAMKAAKIVKSNTVLITRNGATVGIGGGLTSRLDPAIIATRKAADRAEGSVAASDAYFPFPDALCILAHAGVKAIIQPGGSRNDKEVIKAADDLGVAMIFCGTRHFRH